MTRFGYQIPYFTYPGVGPDELFGVVARQAREADTSGFDTVTVMDHFYQLPMMGPPEREMLECYTLLAALAGVTSNVRLSAMVTGNTYRNPALLAKTVTTLDIVSGGRAQLAIGAGWFEEEHRALGFEFGTFSERFERLEEALEIITGMLAGERPSLDGKWYQVSDAINSPAPISKIPIMIGGSGEKKTFRLVARFADASNMTADESELPRKLEALAQRCSEEGRDRSEIVVSALHRACIAPTHDQARAELDDFFARSGMDLSAMGEDDADQLRSMIPYGDPDEIAERFSRTLATGVDGLVLSCIANGHIEGRVALLGETLAPLIG